MKNKFAHEISRIKQFKNQSRGDESKFRQLILTRAGRCSDDKLRRFVQALRDYGGADIHDLAGFIEGVYINK